MAPEGHVNTRDFSSLPRWQYHLFNYFLLSLALASLITAAFAIIGQEGAFLAALIIAVFYLTVFALDLGRIFPAVRDPLPSELLVLEVVDLALGGILPVIALEGILASHH